MNVSKTIRENVVDEAISLIMGDRLEQYGTPQQNFKNIGDSWSIALQRKLKPGESITPADVALLMIHLKAIRNIAGYKHDTAVDLIGYAALYAELSETEEQGSRS